MARELYPFSYHNHTYRCGHSNIIPNTDFIDNAKKNGLTSFGFTCHVPNSVYEYQNFKSRMGINEVGDYIREIKGLKEVYDDIDIKVGFEAEYKKSNLETLVFLKDEVDYLVLGQHELDIKVVDGNYPTYYADSVCEAMDSGLFDIVAHPDIFLTKRNNLSAEEKEKFDKNTTEAMRRICIKAEERGIPLEINIRGFQRGLVYPSRDFFKMCAFTHAKVLFSLDAHKNDDIDTYHENISKCLEYLDIDSLNFTNNSYDPVIERRSNGLDKLYEEFKKTVHTSKYYKAKEILEGVSSSLESNNVVDELLSKIDNRGIFLENEYNTQVNNLRNDNNSREDVIKEGFDKTFEALKSLNTLIWQTIVEGKALGITSLEEMSDFVLTTIEFMSTKNGYVKSDMEKHLSDLITFYQNEMNGGKEKGSSKKLFNPLFGKASEESDSYYEGFTNIAIIGLIVSFIVGFGIGIAYILLQI